jgi:hypothetical protein
MTIQLRLAKGTPTSFTAATPFLSKRETCSTETGMLYAGKQFFFSFERLRLRQNLPTKSTFQRFACKGLL